MGHVYVERLPRTRPWQDVIRLVQDGATAAAVADAVVRAARTVLLPLAQDAGVVEATWHLVRLPLAAREDDFPAALRGLGLDPGPGPGLMDLVAATADALDAAVPPGRRTDLGEMAQAALAETLAGAFGPGLRSLFAENPDDVQAAVAGVATATRFGRLYFTRPGASHLQTSEI